MRINKIFFIIILILISLIFLVKIMPARVNPTDKTVLSATEITQIAIKKAKSDGINLMHRSVCFDVDNKFWKEKLKNMGSINVMKYKFLENKNYQAVCFSPVEIINGDEQWYVVDKRTGEVLASYKGH